MHACALRAGGGPRFIEMTTYRWLEHCGPFDDDHLSYRPHGELDDWKRRDPIRSELARLNVDDAWLSQTEREIAARIDTAFEKAHAAPFPALASARSGIYATEAGAA